MVIVENVLGRLRVGVGQWVDVEFGRGLELGVGLGGVETGAA